MTNPRAERAAKSRQKFLEEQIARIDKSIAGREAVLRDQREMRQRYAEEIDRLTKG